MPANYLLSVHCENLTLTKGYDPILLSQIIRFKLGKRSHKLLYRYDVM